MEQYDVIVIGSGPAGLAAACEAQNKNLNCLIVDRRGLAHSYVEFPQTLRFFSPPDEMAVGGVPFPMRGGDKPTREDALAYFRAVAWSRKLNLATWEEIESLERSGGRLVLTSRHAPSGGAPIRRSAQAVILAVGVWDSPRKLCCPGSDMPHVFSRFNEPTEYLGHPVLVVGGGNSAVTAALSLSEAHASRITLAMRRAPEPYQNHLRPFIVRDLQFAVEEQKIDLQISVIVNRIESEQAWLQQAIYGPDECKPCGAPYPVPARFIFAMLGHTSNPLFLAKLGLEAGLDGRPVSDPKTWETCVPGLYVAGSLVSQNIDIIIKGREQARKVVEIIADRLTGNKT